MDHPKRLWTLAVPGLLLIGGAVVAPFAIGTAPTLAAFQDEPNKPADEEDYPVMPTAYIGFTLKPAGFWRTGTTRGAVAGRPTIGLPVESANG